MRVSVDAAGNQGATNPAVAPTLDRTGRRVAFAFAQVLVPDACGWEIYVRNPKTGTLAVASVGPGGKFSNSSSQEPVLSADGRFVAFESLASNLVEGDSNSVRDIYVRDPSANLTERISLGTDGTEPNSACQSPAISATGRYVAFHTAHEPETPRSSRP